MFTGGRPYKFIKMKYCGIETQLLTCKLISLMKENFECLNDFKTQPGPVAKSATFGYPAGNRTRDLANLVHCSAN